MDISVLKLPHPIPTCFNNQDSPFSCFGSLIEKQIDPQMWHLERERQGGINKVKGFYSRSPPSITGAHKICGLRLLLYSIVIFPGAARGVRPGSA